MSQTVIEIRNLSKMYRLGEVGTGTLSHDLNRWWHKVRGKEDPFLKLGQENKRDAAGGEYVWALKDVSFDVKQGEVLGIIGKNGAGKSTLLKLLSRVTAPTTGSFKAKGRIASLLEVGTGFHPDLTGRENVFLNGAILGMSKEEIKHKFDEIVDFAGVERYIDTPVKRYSSGMYVRLAFGVAAHLESEILIVDEVLAVGDAEFQDKCLGKMQDISSKEGRTVLFVSHNLAAVDRLCSKAILVNRGKLAMEDSPKKVIEEYLLKNYIPGEITFKDNNFLKFLSLKQMGDSLKIICDYDAPLPLELPCLGFVISDSLGNKIFGTNPNYQPPETPIKASSKGRLQIDILYPKLLNGRYNLSVWFGDGKIDYVVMENVLSIEVINMVTYVRETYAGASGPVSPIVEWKYEYQD